MNNNLHFLKLWEEGRTRFSKLLENLKEEDLKKTEALKAKKEKEKTSWQKLWQ